MITAIAWVGPMIWRATWQAAILALVVTILVRCCGERLAAKWRFLLWGVVLLRLVCVVTPASPWSLFNLTRWETAEPAQVVQQEPPRVVTVRAPVGQSPAPPIDEPPPTENLADPASPAKPSEAALSPFPVADSPAAPPQTSWFDFGDLVGWLSLIWLLGVVISVAQLALASWLLRRRLSACRPIEDSVLLARYDEICRQVGLRRLPQLLVTPEPLSPCVVGTWAPRVILPEAVVTEATQERLDHVLAHELAHLRRGDLWTNWLLLAGRALHWFNPIAWWAFVEMQAEREAACDEIAVATLQDSDRASYADTLIELAASFSASGIAPGLVGLFTSKSRLQARVERLLNSPASPLRASVAMLLLAVTGLLGLTDASPRAVAQSSAELTPSEKRETGGDHVIRGTCVDEQDRAPLKGITVTLYRLRGQAGTPEQIGATLTDVEGKFEFAGLEPPRLGHRLDYLQYDCVATAPGWPVGKTFYDQIDGQMIPTIRMTKETTSLRGIVTDADGLPIAGATVCPYAAYNRPLPQMAAAKTDELGAFRIDGIGVFRWSEDKLVPTRVSIRHPDYPPGSGESETLPAVILATMPKGCVVQGKVIDGETGQPVAGVEVTASTKSYTSPPQTVATDAAGKFRMVVAEDNYVFRVGAKDRVAVALGEQDCSAGQVVNLPDFVLMRGGLIEGRVIDTSTGEPIAQNQSGKPLLVGLFGPAELSSQLASASVLATVDPQGRFQMRAAPGDNFPYVFNMHADRISWDTEKQPPVIVKAGETTHYDLTITPAVLPEEKVKAAEALIARLPEDKGERTSEILRELREPNGDAFEDCERWTRLVRELVKIGPAAVPQITAELDQADDENRLRKLSFALRAIGDPSAVPALIRAIPRTLRRPSSDCGIKVVDQGLNQFMQKHDLDEQDRGSDFGYGRPVREVFGALQKLTGQDFDDKSVYSIHLSEDPRRQEMQRRRYERQAEGWRTWWEENWRSLTQDASLANVGLRLTETPVVSQPELLGPTAKSGDGVIGMRLSPLREKGKYVDYFIDLDTGEQPRPPQAFVKPDAPPTETEVAAWAAQQGIDLICVPYKTAAGKEMLALKAIGMKVRELSPSELRNLDKILATGKLPAGQPAGELLIHVDAETKQRNPDVDSAFLFTTKEGSLGLIETRMYGRGRSSAASLFDPNGDAAGPTSRSVLFDMHEIIP
ncbi:M56 family metallopeptidase [Blastopirellula retiformator]|uniref:Regulatory protein BlaR1 n=1 Tax=Blastopirellula retiformator TaxID=2527970 RepID=A0A5C5UYV3_9BACT|nr:M56 family metallopeptidase [Blastopirellula retiformator]TWT31546.1 Regulatory protein BlaR1 [Blastopirellula retiformator]